MLTEYPHLLWGSSYGKKNLNSYSLMVGWIITAIVEISMEAPGKSEKEFMSDPAVLLLGTHPKD